MKCVLQYKPYPYRNKVHYKIVLIVQEIVHYFVHISTGDFTQKGSQVI